MMPSPSVLRAFAQTSITTQLDIASRVRHMQNHDYVLFDKDFHRVSVTRVGNYRVEIDTMGRKGVLCRAAQDNFTFAEYLEFAKTDPIYSDIKVLNDKVYLTAKAIIKTTIDDDLLLK